MIPIYNIIISPKGDRYNNSENGIIMNAHIDEKDFHFTNRIGVVEKLPLIDTPFEVGDEVIVHHNVFRKYWNFKGKLRTSSNDLDGMFSVYQDQIFAYKRDSVWITIDEWVFIAPQEASKDTLTLSLDPYTKRVGTVVISKKPNLVGETVGFTPASEYEFNIDGQKMYKMRERDITCKIYE